MTLVGEAGKVGEITQRDVGARELRHGPVKPQPSHEPSDADVMVVTEHPGDVHWVDRHHVGDTLQVDVIEEPVAEKLFDNIEPCRRDRPGRSVQSRRGSEQFQAQPLHGQVRHRVIGPQLMCESPAQRSDPIVALLEDRVEQARAGFEGRLAIMVGLQHQHPSPVASEAIAVCIVDRLRDDRGRRAFIATSGEPQLKAAVEDHDQGAAVVQVRGKDEPWRKPCVDDPERAHIKRSRARASRGDRQGSGHCGWWVHVVVDSMGLDRAHRCEHDNRW